MFRPIEDHGIIGDLKTVALVARDATIDFFCLPEFDGPTVFAALLDPEKGGHFSILPVHDHVRYKQLYLPDTNILLTRLLSDRGVAEISDFMPVDQSCRIVRRVKTIRGSITFRMECKPRFDYARERPTIACESESCVVFRGTGYPSGLRLHSSAPLSLRIEDDGAVVEFTLNAGERLFFILEEAKDYGERDKACLAYVTRAFLETGDFWRNWIERSNYKGRWRETVNRSALVLKLLTSKNRGSLLAAATFGLPEEIGGKRNWDYRYTWVRDASFTVYALMRLGFVKEAQDFTNWMMDRFEGHPEVADMQIMYGIDGRRDLEEKPLPHLSGYRDSRPVLIGNGAYKQLQLDIYGELMDAVYLAAKYGDPVGYDTWRHLSGMVDWVCGNWHLPDEGIWEIRGGRRAFLSSRLMCWVAVDRGLRMSTKYSLPAPYDRWEDARNAIHYSIYEDFWDEEMGCFVQYKGAKALDASTLLMPLVKFISPVDPRWLSTMKRIDEHLVKDTLVLRYDTASGVDGLDGGEGAFSTCSFWYVECLARAGETTQARLVFEKMLSYANHLGLYAEELSFNGEHLGNFPQALTHLALISAAFSLDRALDRRHRP